MVAEIQQQMVDLRERRIFDIEKPISYEPRPNVRTSTSSRPEERKT